MIQLLFQVYAGTSVLDEFFNNLLEKVIVRMNTVPMLDHLKRHLLSVLLTALAYNPIATLSFLDQRSLVDEFFQQVLQDKMCEGFTNAYERKTFIIGLSSALNAGQLPSAMMGHMLKIVQEIIRMLGRLKVQEAKALKKAAKQEINQNAEDEGDEEEDDDQNYEDDEESEEEDEDTMQDESADVKKQKSMPKASKRPAQDSDEGEEPASDDDDDGNGGLGF